MSVSSVSESGLTRPECNLRFGGATPCRHKTNPCFGDSKLENLTSRIMHKTGIASHIDYVKKSGNGPIPDVHLRPAVDPLSRNTRSVQSIYLCECLTPSPQQRLNTLPLLQGHFAYRPSSDGLRLIISLQHT